MAGRRGAIPALRRRSIVGAVAAALLMTTAGCSSPPPAGLHAERARAAMQDYVDGALDFLSSEGLDAGGAEWQSVLARTVATTAEARSVDDVVGALILATFNAGGPAGAYLHADTVERMAGAAASAVQAPAEVRIEGEAGVVTVPPVVVVGRPAQSAWAAAAASGIEAASGSVRCGWVVDLRGVSSGEALPAIAAVSPLLDAGPVTGSVDREGRSIDVVVGPAGVHRTDDVGRTMAIPRPTESRIGAHVAVLIGGGTREAGEQAALAFRGQDDVRMFGRATIGHTVETETLGLPDGASLVVGHAIVVDRDLRSAPYGLAPDVRISGLQDGGDATLAAAEAWLSAVCG